MQPPTRAGWVGGSSINKVMAGGQGKTREAYMGEVIAARLTGEWPETYCSNDMLRGIELEADAVAVYSFVTGNECIETDFIPHPSIEGFGCTPDRLIGDDGVLEVKTVKPHVQIKNLLAGKVPSEYVNQVQTELLVTGRDWLDFVSYAPELGEEYQLFIKRVYPDHELHIKIENAVEQFLQDTQDMMDRLKGG